MMDETVDKIIEDDTESVWIPAIKIDTENDQLQILSDSELFLAHLEYLNSIKFPTYVKKILTLTNCANYISFREINSETIDKLEEFAREDMELVIEEDDNRADFFGIYHKKPGKFKFLMGDRSLILQIVSSLQKCPRPSSYWTSPLPTPTKNQENHGLNLRSKTKFEPKTLTVSSSSTNEKNSSIIAAEKIKVTSLIEQSLHNLIDRCSSSISDKKIKKKLKLLKEKVSTKKLNIEVFIKTIYDDNNHPYDHTYEAKINCIECSSIITLGKQQKRWIISNYIRHVKIHVPKYTSGKKSAKKNDDDDGGEDDEEEEEAERVDENIQYLNSSENSDNSDAAGHFIFSSKS